jgi:hypothetical protein
MAGLSARFQQIMDSVGDAKNSMGKKFSGPARAINTPLANTLGGAALGAGLSVAGNAMNGELEDKGLGRIALEALGAGALGATAGGVIGGMNRNAGVANYMSNHEISAATPPGKRIQGFLEDKSNVGMYLNGIGDTIGQSAAMLGGATALGGLGGLVGGGLSDLTQSVGVPGFGSSNTASAKAGMSATASTAYPAASTAYPADPNMGMSNEEMYLASLGYLPMG